MRNIPGLTPHLHGTAALIMACLNIIISSPKQQAKKLNNNRHLGKTVFIPPYPTSSRDQGFGALALLRDWCSHSCSLKICWAQQPADTADFHLSSSSSCGCQSHQLHGKPWCYQSAQPTVHTPRSSKP